MMRSQFGASHPLIKRLEKEIQILDTVENRMEDGPTYSGKSLAYWLELLEKERERKQVLECIHAIAVLAEPEDASRVIATMLPRLERLLGSDRQTPSTIMYILDKLLSADEYLDLLLDAFHAGTDKVRTEVLRAGLEEIDAQDFVRSKHYVAWRETIVNEVLATSTTPSPNLSTISGQRFLEWYDALAASPNPLDTASSNKAIDAAEELLEPLVESKHLRQKFWVDAFEENRPELARMTVRNVEATLCNPSSSSEEIINAFGKFMHASRYEVPRLERRNEVVSQIGKRLQDTIEDDGIRYEIVESFDGFGRYLPQPFIHHTNREKPWTTLALDVGNTRAETLNFVFACLDFISSLHQERQIEETLVFLEEASRKGAGDAKQFVNTIGIKPMLSWPRMALDRRRSTRLSNTATQFPLFPPDWKDSHWLDAFTHDRVTIMLARIRTGTTETP
ncbi:MAG: hypothetical protein AAGJ83_12050 [Planctomycetota bacterium]